LELINAFSISRSAGFAKHSSFGQAMIDLRLSNGITMPAIAFGTWQLSQDEAYFMVKHALASGVVLNTISISKKKNNLS
jgi:hypothetical protein